MSEDLTPEQAQQVADRDELVQVAMIATDSFYLDHAAELAHRVTSASRSRLIVEASVGALLSLGVITVKPKAEWPEWMPVGLPDHLQPDVAAAVDELRRINRAMGVPR